MGRSVLRLRRVVTLFNYFDAGLYTELPLSWAAAASFWWLFVCDGRSFVGREGFKGSVGPIERCYVAFHFVLAAAR